MFKRLNKQSFRFIKPLSHAYLDYFVVLLFLILPFIFGFSAVPLIVSVSWAIIHLTLTLLTAFPGGLVKWLLFSVHGWIEFTGGVVLIFIPWLIGHETNETIRIYFILSGLTLLVLWMLTDYSTRVADEYFN